MGKPQEMCYWLHDAFGLVSFSAAVYFSAAHAFYVGFKLHSVGGTVLTPS